MDIAGPTKYRKLKIFKEENFRDFREWLSNYENFVHEKKKSRLPCDNLAHAYNIHDRQYTFELTNHFIFSREPSRVPMMALFKYFKRSNPLPLPEGPLSMKAA